MHACIHTYIHTYNAVDVIECDTTAVCSQSSNQNPTAEIKIKTIFVICWITWLIESHVQ